MVNMRYLYGFNNFDAPRITHNFFTQIAGAKNVTLVPPCAIDALHLYPDLHVRARKVR